MYISILKSSPPSPPPHLRGCEDPCDRTKSCQQSRKSYFIIKFIGSTSGLSLLLLLALSPKIFIGAEFKIPPFQLNTFKYV